MLEFIFFHAHGRKMTMVSRQELLDRLEAAGYPGQVNPLGRKIRPQSRRWPIVVTGPSGRPWSSGGMTYRTT